MLEYFNPIKDGEELTINVRIHRKTYTPTLFPKLNNYNEKSIKECNIKDGTFVFTDFIRSD
jgi:hypothetical protein